MECLAFAIACIFGSCIAGCRGLRWIPVSLHFFFLPVFVFCLAMDSTQEIVQMGLGTGDFCVVEGAEVAVR